MNKRDCLTPNCINVMTGFNTCTLQYLYLTTLVPYNTCTLQYLYRTTLVPYNTCTLQHLYLTTLVPYNIHLSCRSFRGGRVCS